MVYTLNDLHSTERQANQNKYGGKTCILLKESFKKFKWLTSALILNFL